MQSIKQIFFRLALLVGIGFSTVYADNCCNYYCSNPCPLGTGFLVGVYGSFQTVFFEVRDKLTLPTPVRRSFERYNMIQKAPGGGVFFSYGCDFCDRFVAAVRFDVVGLAESAEHAYREGTDDSDAADISLHEAQLRWITDLTFQPGVLIGNCLLAYFKVGGTLGKVREQTWVKNDEAPYEDEDRTFIRHYPGGYVLGAGANVTLLNCFSFFAEYTWRSYVSNMSSLQAFATDDVEVRTDTRITTFHSNAFSFGVAMQF